MAMAVIGTKEPKAFDSSVVAAAVTGGLLAFAGRRRGGFLGALIGVAGLGLIARAVAPRVVDALLQAGARRREVRLDLSFQLDRPVHEVFEFCKDFENFPQLIASLRRVIDYEDGRSHWIAISPAGHGVEWDAVITKYVPHTIIAWQSVPGSTVKSNGTMRFQPSSTGGTRVELHFCYEPLTTRLDDALHAIVSPTREAQVRADLSRARFFFGAMPRTAPYPDRTIDASSGVDGRRTA